MPSKGQSRSLRVNGQKIAAARGKRDLVQQSFADDARVSLRSLQRAEKGGPVSKGILNSIASELGFNPEELIVITDSDEDNSAKNGRGILILKPILNYSDIPEVLEYPEADTLDVDYFINPPDELVDIIADVISIFEHICVPLDEQEHGPQSPSELFKKRMSLNNKIEKINECGIFIFARSYTKRSLVWALGTYDDAATYFWGREIKITIVLRFYGDTAEEKKSVAVEVDYGLSREVMDWWVGDTRKEVAKYSLSGISSEMMINPNIEPLPRNEDGEIPF